MLRKSIFLVGLLVDAFANATKCESFHGSRIESQELAILRTEKFYEILFSQLSAKCMGYELSFDFPRKKITMREVLTRNMTKVLFFLIQEYLTHSRNS